MSKHKAKLKGYSFCSLCSYAVEIYAFGSCFHPICYRCSTKLRILNEDRRCPLCTTFLGKVLFTTTLAPEKEFNTDTFIKDEQYGIWLETIEIRKMYRNLLFHKCPEPGCNKKYINFIDLRHHCNLEHKKFFCPLCLKNDNIFTDERHIYSNVACASKGKRLEGIQITETSELWEHSASEHFVCNHVKCIGQSKGIFDTSAALEEHVQTTHSSDSIEEYEYSIASKPNKKNRVMANRDSAGPSSSKSNFKQTAGEIEGEGQIINISINFGFIERDGHHGDFSENVFFNNQSCGVAFTYDLTEAFSEGDRVSFHAKCRLHRNSSKWRATYVTKVSKNSTRYRNTNGVISNNKKPIKPVNNDSSLSSEYTESNPLKGRGVIHCNLGPTYGFIIPKGGVGTNYSENIYFNLKSLQRGRERHVYDLTEEFNINEEVTYELEEPEKSCCRPEYKQLRAIKVWKCHDKEQCHKEQLNDDQANKTSSDESISLETTEETSNYFGSVYGSAMNGIENVYDKPGCSKDPVYDFGVDFDDLNLFGKEFEAFRKVLKVIMGRGKNGSIDDFDMQLTSNCISLTQIAYIHFTLQKCPKVLSVLLEKTPLNGAPSNRSSFSISSVYGFNASGLKDLVKDKMIVQAGDDLFYVDDSSSYMMVFRNSIGKISEIFLHANFKCV